MLCLIPMQIVVGVIWGTKHPEFAARAPVYVPSLDPHSMFDAWHAVVFYLAVLGVMFLMLSLRTRRSRGEVLRR